MQKEYEFCLRCGRKLKNPESKKIGYGTICWKKAQANTQNKPLLFTMPQ